VYSTGNGSVADVGWVARNDGGAVEDHDAAAATLIGRLNLAPPRLARGMSAMAEAPLPPADGDPVEYSPQSAWEEHWVGEGPRALVLYVDPRSEFRYQLEPPRDGVSEARAALLPPPATRTTGPHADTPQVRSFPGGMDEWAAWAFTEGVYSDDDDLSARVAGEAIHLHTLERGGGRLIDAWVHPRLLSGCAALAATVKLAAGLAGCLDVDLDELDALEEEPDVDAWPAFLAFLKEPDATLLPVAVYEASARPYKNFPRPHLDRMEAGWRRTLEHGLRALRAEAVNFGCAALTCAVDAQLQRFEFASA